MIPIIEVGDGHHRKYGDQGISSPSHNWSNHLDQSKNVVPTHRW
mgnify:CR=1 FL=1